MVETFLNKDIAGNYLNFFRFTFMLCTIELYFARMKELKKPFSLRILTLKKPFAKVTQITVKTNILGEVH